MAESPSTFFDLLGVIIGFATLMLLLSILVATVRQTEVSLYQKGGFGPWNTAE